MNWRNKARVAALIARLPSQMSHSTYYFLQRHYGTLRKADPIRNLKTGPKILELIEKYRDQLRGSETFLEVGTGRGLALPFALWLGGAYRIITVDLNRYLKEEIVFEELDYIKEHEEVVGQYFGARSQSAVYRERLAFLLNHRKDLNGLLAAMNIRYEAPANAAQLNLPAQSIHYHVSSGVVQHIPPSTLAGIFTEAKRLLTSTGLSIHYVSLGDLFATVDPSISPVNFLQFSDEQWESIAGNRYMYHNRLRPDELCELVESAGFKLLSANVAIDPASLRVLKGNGLSLDRRFAHKSPETNAADNVWLTAAPGEPMTGGTAEDTAKSSSPRHRTSAWK